MIRSSLNILLGEWLNAGFWLHFATRLKTQQLHGHIVCFLYPRIKVQARHALLFCIVPKASPELTLCFMPFFLTI